MILLLDTTVLIDALRPRSPRRALLEELSGNHHALTTAAINVAEVYAGLRPEEEAFAAEFFAGLQCYPVTHSIARRAGQMKYVHARLGRTLSLADTMVAATALEHDLILATDNRKDFIAPGLRFYTLS